jgi:hypothetical protein
LRPEVKVLSDVDLAVEIVPKDGDRDRLEEQNRRRVEELAHRGRKFRNILEIHAYWYREVFRFLKGRSRVVSLADYAAEKSLILKVPHQILLGEDEQLPLLSRTQRRPGKRSGQPRDCPF